MKHARYDDLADKIAIVTGGLGNLGREICREFSNQGINLVVLDKIDEDREFFDELRRKRVSVDYFKVDFGEKNHRDIFFKIIQSNYKRIDIIVNNAAFVGTSDLPGWAVDFKDQSLQTWTEAIEVNLTTPFHLIQCLESNLRESENPVIINLGSIYGTYGPDWELYRGTQMGNPAAYAASKGGVIQLSRWLATTLAPKIRVNCVSPGGIFRGQDNDFVTKYNARNPLGRMATEFDVVAAIVFLSSESSAYITGQNIHVDGGWSAW